MGHVAAFNSPYYQISLACARGRAARHGARSREPPHHGLKHAFWAPLLGARRWPPSGAKAKGCTMEPQGCHLGPWRSLGAPRTTTDSWGGKA